MGQSSRECVGRSVKDLLRMSRGEVGTMIDLW